MNYTVSKTKRNLIIFSAVFLILKAITLQFFSRSMDSADPDLVIFGIERFLQTVAHGYIMIMLYAYFRHYELKSLQVITLGLLALEIVGGVIQLSFINGMIEPNHVKSISAIVWSLGMLIWIIFLFRNSVPVSPALISIRKYAISVLAVIPLSAVFPLLIVNFVDVRQNVWFVMTLIGVIPYIFIIEFALKLKIRE
jgi:hypothetical protein